MLDDTKERKKLSLYINVASQNISHTFSHGVVDTISTADATACSPYTVWPCRVRKTNSCSAQLFLKIASRIIIVASRIIIVAKVKGKRD
tara:strand:- start:254 stop:520 length:267 start_codon:yes stop_codon:yes gene_type:complete